MAAKVGVGQHIDPGPRRSLARADMKAEAARIGAACAAELTFAHPHNTCLFEHRHHRGRCVQARFEVSFVAFRPGLQVVNQGAAIGLQNDAR